MEHKRVLIFTNHFYPENFRVNDIAFEFSKAGYQVTVLTGIPNYPAGKFFKGYSLFKKRREIVNGVLVIRVPLIPRGKGTGLRLAVNYFSYAFFLTVWSFFLSLYNKYDIILVHHTSPIFLAVPAIMVKKMQHINLLFWNLDLWPESVMAASSFRSGFVISTLDKLVRFIYKNSDKILISSMAFKESMLIKGADERKIIYFPNWAEDDFLVVNEEVKLPKINLRGNQMNIMFAGNIGEAQDMENVFKAMLYVKECNQMINWIFVGEGRKSEWLKEQCAKNNLQENVAFLGYHSIDKMSAFFKIADAMLVSLKDEKIFSYTMPAKIQAYMLSKKAVLAMLDGEGARVIRNARCGLVCKSGDYQTLGKIVLQMAALKEEERRSMGINGYDFYKKYFEKEKTLKTLLGLM